MRAPESRLERYMSKRILFFAYLMSSSVSGPKVLKKRLRFAIFNFSEKLQNIFDIRLKKYVVMAQKLLLNKRYLEVKNSQTSLCFLYVELATVQI